MTNDKNFMLSLASTGISTPWSSLANVILYIFRMDAAAINTESSAKWRPGHILHSVYEYHDIHNQTPTCAPSSESESKIERVSDTRLQKSLWSELFRIWAKFLLVTKHSPIYLHLQGVFSTCNGVHTTHLGEQCSLLE